MLEMGASYIFVVNPNAGTKSKQYIIDQIHLKFKYKYAYQILYWESAGEDIILKIQNALPSGNHAIVVAVGGDGTVNTVARSICGTEHILGIIPIGSGNGLARQLQLPLKADLAIDFLINSRKKIKAIDTCDVNNKKFFCTSGVGFDAHIGKLFAESKSRGLKTYIKIVFKEFFYYKNSNYEIHIDDTIVVSKNAFLITVANANQYGNDVIISPLSVVDDGFMNVVIIKKVNIFNVLLLVFRLFSKTIHKSDYVETYMCKKLDIYRDFKGAIHFDGEPSIDLERLHYSIDHKNLRVFVPAF